MLEKRVIKLARYGKACNESKQNDKKKLKRISHNAIPIEFVKLFCCDLRSACPIRSYGSIEGRTLNRK